MLNSSFSLFHSQKGSPSNSPDRNRQPSPSSNNNTKCSNNPSNNANARRTRPSDTSSLPSNTYTSQLNTSGLLTTWSGSSASSRPFRRVQYPTGGPDVFIIDNNSSPNTKASLPQPSTSNSSRKFSRPTSMRRSPPHSAWHVKPTSLVSKSISAPHRSSSLALLRGRQFGQPVIDVHAPHEWTITSLDVTIPAAREEDTSPPHSTNTNTTNTNTTNTTNNDTRRLQNNVSKSKEDQIKTNRNEKNTTTNNTNNTNNNTTAKTTSKTHISLKSSTGLVRSVSGRYTSYVIRVVAGHKTWHITHRYSDFEQLHISLRTTLGRSILPPLPPKYRFQFNNLNSSFVEKRRLQLEVYLSTLVRIEQVWSCQRLMVDFLDNNIETLGMQTKYERMMRVQGVLMRASQMNATKNAVTERRLNESIRQVDILTSKISQLEAIVLKQQQQMEEDERTKLEALAPALMNGTIQDEIARQIAQHLALHNGNMLDPSNTTKNNIASTNQTLTLMNSSSDSYGLTDVGDGLCFPLCAPTINDNDQDSDAYLRSQIYNASKTILLKISPRITSGSKRSKVIRFVSHVVKSCLGVDVYLTGSYPTKTYLPDGDIDMTACVCTGQEETWYGLLLDALCKSIQTIQTTPSNTTDEKNNDKNNEKNNDKNNDATNNDTNDTTNTNQKPSPSINSVLRGLPEDLRALTVRNATFVNADVKLVKCVIDNIKVDVSAKQFNALSAVRLVEEFDRSIDDRRLRYFIHSPATWQKEKHLFKKSVLLIKAWLTYDAPFMLTTNNNNNNNNNGYNNSNTNSSRMHASRNGGATVPSSPDDDVLFGSERGGLSTYALVVMVIMLFNSHNGLNTKEEKDRQKNKQNNQQNNQQNDKQNVKLDKEMLEQETNQTTTPLDVLCLFLDVFSTWQWGLHAVTVHGPIHIYTGEIVSHTSSSMSHVGSYNGSKFNALFFDRFRTLVTGTTPSKSKKNNRQDKKHTSTSKNTEDITIDTNEKKDLVDDTDSAALPPPHYFDSTKFRLSACNVVDPIDRRNNVGRAMPRSRLIRLSNGLLLGKRQMRAILSHWKNVKKEDQKINVSNKSNQGNKMNYVDDNVLSSMFSKTLRRFGTDGSKRPDLLSHPRQSHYQAAAAAAAAAASNKATSNADINTSGLYTTMRRGRKGNNTFTNTTNTTTITLNTATTTNNTNTITSNTNMINTTTSNTDNTSNTTSCNAARDDNDDPLLGDLNVMKRSVEYAEIVATVGWTSESLRNIVIQLIVRQSRGGVVLPVGEIGKGLLERTGNASIMSEIKERYGGLKRFLESQNGIRVNDDHPFNPSVTLDKSQMTEALLAQIGAVENDLDRLMEGGDGNVNGGNGSFGSSGYGENGESTSTGGRRKKRGKRNKKKRQKLNSLEEKEGVVVSALDEMHIDSAKEQEQKKEREVESNMQIQQEQQEQQVQQQEQQRQQQQQQQEREQEQLDAESRRRSLEEEFPALS